MQDSRLLLLFRGCKAGVLRIREGDVDSHWLVYYDLVPTKESVERIGGLLLESSTLAPYCNSRKTVAFNLRSALGAVFAKAIRYCLGEKTIAGPRNLLSAIIRKKASVKLYDSLVFLARYIVFRAVLFGGLCTGEAEALKSISFELPIDWFHYFRFGQLVDDLTGQRCGDDLFVALVNNFETAGVRDALSELSTRCPEIVTKLTLQYIEGSKKDTAKVSQPLFLCLDIESQYHLFSKGAIRWMTSELVNWRSFYILSRFSELPSEDVKELCLNKRPEYLAYEEKAQEVEGSFLIRMDHLDPKQVPKEIWIMILLWCNNLLFQVYTIPMVCKFWRYLHGNILSRSKTVHTAFVKDVKDASEWDEVLNFHRYPWNYFLKSPQAFLNYTILCLESTLSEIGHETNLRMKKSWKKFMQEICRDASPISPESYFDLYVRFCRITGVLLEFYQPPGMSDDQYITCVRNLVVQHKIIPDLPKRFFNEDCGKLVRALEDDGSIVTSLIGRDAHYGDLAVNLLLARHHVPPTVDKVLRERSASYRLLMSKDRDADGRKRAILESDFSVRALTHGMVRLCLANGPEYNPEVLNSLREISGCYSSRCYEGGMADSIFVHSSDTRLCLNVVVFLCKHCQEYSEEEFRTVERVLGQYGILNSDGSSQAFELCAISKLFGGHNIAVDLIQ